MDSFTVYCPTSKLSLDNLGSTAATYNVTNKTAKPLRIQLKVRAQGNAKREWFQLLGEQERDLPASNTTTATINIQIPKGTPAGEYRVRLDVANSHVPEDVKEGPDVTFEVKPNGDPNDPHRKWKIVAGVVSAIVVGTLLAWIFWPKPEVPNLMELKAGEIKELEDEITKLFVDHHNLILGELVPQSNSPKKCAPYKVNKQDPEAGTKYSEQVTVKVMYEGTTESLPVPNWTNKSFGEVAAFAASDANKLTYHATPNTPLTHVISRTEPAAGTMVCEDDEIKLVTAAPTGTPPKPPLCTRPWCNKFIEGGILGPKLRVE
jgi:hypothetical protein